MSNSLGEDIQNWSVAIRFGLAKPEQWLQFAYRAIGECEEPSPALADLCLASTNREALELLADAAREAQFAPPDTDRSSLLLGALSISLELERSTPADVLRQAIEIMIRDEDSQLYGALLDLRPVEYELGSRLLVLLKAFGSEARAAFQQSGVPLPV